MAQGHKVWFWLSSATQHAMPLEYGRKWGTEYLNTGFPLPTLLCAGYNVKLIKNQVNKKKTSNRQFDVTFLD